MFKIIEKAKVWFTISLVIIAVGMGFLVFRGLNLGIDFAGGTVLQVDLKKQVSMEELREITSKYDSGANVTTADVTGISIRSSNLTEEQVDSIKNEINEKYGVDPASWTNETVGPSIGKELTRNALLAIVISTVAMMIYVALRFEFKFGVAAVLALVHDVLVTLSVYAILGIPVNSSFIAAVLTIIGYSINDTIVIFDRIRENMRLMKKTTYAELANVSIIQTMARSINTGLTTLFTITALYIVGVSAVQELALPLIIGIVSGAYSTIFLASPIWVALKNREKKKKAIA